MTAATHALPVRDWRPAFAVLLLAGLGARLMFLGDRALWLDEAYSVWFSDQDWTYLWQSVPQFETHPPLYYSLLKLWRAFGSTETSLRLLSVLANTATIVLVALAGHLAAPRPYKLPLALAAALLFAAAPLQLIYAQEARPYALLVLAMAIVLCSAIWIVTHPERASRRLTQLHRRDRAALAAFLALGVGMAMLLWMHNLGIVFAAVLAAILAAWWICRGRRGAALFVNLLAAALLAVTLYAPNIPNLLLQVRSVSAQFWLEIPTPAQLYLMTELIYGQLQIAFWGSAEKHLVQLVVAVPLGVLGVRGIWRLTAESPDRRWVAWLLLGTAFGPTLVMLALTYSVQPVMMERTLLPVQVPWMLLCAAAPFAVRPDRAALVAGLFIAIAVVNLGGFVANQATQEHREEERPWRAIAQQIAQSNAPDAPVILLPNSAGLPLAYYDDLLNLGLTMQPLPAPYPVRGEVHSYPAGGQGVPAMDAAALHRLAEATGDAPTVWLITRFEVLFDPQRLVRHSLAARFPCAKSTHHGLITVSRFDRAAEGTKAGHCRSNPPRSSS
ncbi:hypothetical protein AAFN88_08160 [Pelagibius sp. CAU 1746]|uniref:hypothetical protein n=1 Tax=Pelagibius sp. CAU 1746 TaxID=3140370 RepID=UPI00325B7586